MREKNETNRSSGLHGSENPSAGSAATGTPGSGFFLKEALAVDIVPAEGRRGACW